MKNKYDYVMVRLLPEERKELDELLKRLKISRRKFILKLMEVYKDEINL